jgi:hypothetical protein
MKAVFVSKSKPKAFVSLVGRVSRFPCTLHTRYPLTLALADNHMINGTKLLNVAGMTRGRRDGILKSEKTRHVVKIGPMHLKGVW